jgi:hypothetical protein
MGNRRLPLLGWIVCLCLSIMISGSCRKRSDEPTRVPPPERGEIKGDLRVQHASPEGPTATPSESREILVVFDRPMAPLAPLPLAERTEFLRITPAVAGQYRWMGTRTVSFAPKEPLPFGSEFKVAVPAGTRSLDGYVLKEERAWTFTTMRPRVVRTVPDRGADQQPLATDLLLVFNQPVEARSARSFIAFEGAGSSGSGRAIGFSAGRPGPDRLKAAEIDAPAERVLQLKPESPLEPGTTYVVSLKAGLPGTQGPLGLEKPLEINFKTYEEFKFVRLANDGPIVPGVPLQLVFTNQVIYKEIISRIHFEPKVEIPDYYASWDHGDQRLYLSLLFAPETKYTAVIDAGLKDAFGNPLGREARFEFTTAAYPPSVRMTSGLGVLESDGPLQYAVSVMNSKEARLMAAPFARDAVVPLLENDGAFDTSKLIVPAGGFAVDRVLPLPALRNKRTPVPLDVAALLGSKTGFLFLQLDTLSAEKWERYPKVFLQATNLGLSAKFSPENNVIWVTGLRTGLPVAGAEVEIRDEGNAVRWRGRTGEDGRAESPGWRVLGIRSRETWSKPKQWVFARSGEDTVVLSSEWGTGLDPYRFDIAYDWRSEPEPVRGEIFTERGIYRAGETVHVKGILRTAEKGAWTAPVSLPVDWEIRDPFGKSVQKSPARTDAFGSFSFDVETRENAALGSYRITAKLSPQTPGGPPVEIEGSFRVEAFRPAEFEVYLKTQKDSYVFGEAYKAEVRGAFLFGGAMIGQKAQWSLRLNPVSFAPPGWKEFQFGESAEFWIDEANLSERSRLLSSGEGTLGADGRLPVESALVAAKERSTVSATLEATVQGPSRRSISSRIDTVIHRGTFYIGVKPSSTFIRKGEALSAGIIAVTPDGASVADTAVSVRLIKREWKSVRRAGVGGRFEWVSETSDAEIESRTVRTQAGPVEIPFKPAASGMYILRAAGRDPRKNEVSTSVYLYVTGTDYVPWQRDDDDKLELVSGAESYRPGETARILVKSPYESAKALVTIEREFVLKSMILDIRGSASEIEIPITAEHIPNVFVSVLLVQGRTASAGPADQDVGKPAFKMGYVSLSVDASEKRLKVEVRPDRPKYKPREKVVLKLGVRNAGGAAVRASVTLAVVDLGVLNLIGYQTPDLHAAFYGEKPLSVQTSESRLHVVGERSYGEKGENVGGGGAMKMAAPAGLSEVELRGDFKSTVYWNPSILTDEKGDAAVEFTLPDNLTTFRVMAVAQTRDSLFGSGRSDLQVAKPLLLLPSIPRFARVGDAFKGGIVLHNNSDAVSDAAVSLEARGIKSESTAAPRSVHLQPGASAEVLFDLTADRTGTAVLAFRALSGAESDGLELKLPIVIPRPTESVATYDTVTEAAKEESIAIPGDALADRSRLDLQASASALAGLGGSVDYLTNYPYLCLEQRLSSILPYLVASRIIQDFKMSTLSSAEIRTLVARNLRESYACQKDNGGFGLWPDSPFESPFVSAYAVFALLQARSAGYAVDASRLENGLKYLRDFVRTRPDSSTPYPLRSWNTTQAYALYLLALAGNPEPAYNEKFFSERDRLTLQGKTWLLKALHLAGQAEARAVVLREILNLAKTTPGLSHFEEGNEDDLRWIYSSNVRTTAVILQTLLEIGSDDPLLGGAAKWFVAERRTGRWATTQENFFVFYALNEYYRTAEGGSPDFKAVFTLAGKTILEETFRSPNRTATATAALADLGAGKTVPLRISRDGRGILYYGARLTYARSGPLEPRDEGFAIYKKIETVDGRPLEEVKAGSLVAVTLELAVPKQSLFVVVDDPLPAGFEAVNADLRTESEERQRELAQLGAADEEDAWSGFNHVEMRDDRVLLFADSLEAGIHRFKYLARALTGGTFTLPGAKAEEMYAPEVFGRSGERTLKIVR